jgi:hypothetical protein
MLRVTLPSKIAMTKPIGGYEYMKVKHHYYSLVVVGQFPPLFFKVDTLKKT